MDVILYANTSGRGHWSEVRKEVLVKRIQVEEAQVDETGHSVYLKVRFDRKTWNVNKDGLIYTDAKFLRQFRRGLIEMGLKPRIANKVDYTEQGMQGTGFVSMAFHGVNHRDAKLLMDFLGSKRRFESN